MNTNQNPVSEQNQQPTLTQPAITLPRMLSLKQVVYFTGLGSTTIYDMMNSKSNRYDPTFPRQVKLGKNRVAWVESEIAEWLHAKMQDRIA